jgi:hypothetical protein
MQLAVVTAEILVMSPGACGNTHHGQQLRKSSMHLRHFPWDCQEIKLKLRYADVCHGRRGGYACQYLIPVKSTVSPSATLEEEWGLYGGVNADEKLECGQKVDVELCLFAVRKPSSFLTNVLVPDIMTTLVNFTTICIDAEDFGGRTGIALAAMLTAVALEISLHDVLPRLPYSSALDTPLLFSYVVPFVVILLDFAASMMPSFAHIELPFPLGIVCTIRHLKRMAYWKGPPLSIKVAIRALVKVPPSFEM